MSLIKLTIEHQEKIKSAKNYHDAYFVDILLTNNEIKYHLCAREKINLEPTSTCNPKDYSFNTEDIKDIRPAISGLRKIQDPWKTIKEKT